MKTGCVIEVKAIGYGAKIEGIVSLGVCGTYQRFIKTRFIRIICFEVVENQGSVTRVVIHLCLKQRYCWLSFMVSHERTTEQLMFITKLYRFGKYQGVKNESDIYNKGTVPRGSSSQLTTFVKSGT
jgi:hypothetical protein